MTSVIVVDDDEAFLRTIERELRREGMQVRATASSSSALEMLREERTDVLLTDLKMDEMDGLALLEAARRIAPMTRGVVMSGHASAGEYESALSLGAVRVLLKPFDTARLLEAVRQAADCDRGFRGSVHGVAFVDLLQLFHYGRRSVRVDVFGERRGAVLMEGGEIVHAEFGAETGEPALRALFGQVEGALRTTAFSAPKDRTIARGFEELLLDSIRILDEQTAPGGVSESAGENGNGSVRPYVGTLGTTITSRFRSAFPEVSSGLSMVVIAMQLSNGACACLRGAISPAEFGAPIFDLVDAARRLTGSPTGMVERLSDDTAVHVVWDDPGDVAFLLAHGFRATSQVVWLRNVAQTFARKLFGMDA